MADEAIACPLAPAECRGLGCPFNGLGAPIGGRVLCPVMLRLMQDASPDRVMTPQEKDRPTESEAGGQVRRRR